MKELVTVHLWTESYFVFFFLITSSRPLPSLLQQPTENFTTVAGNLEATIMIRAEILCLKKTEPKSYGDRYRLYFRL